LFCEERACGRLEIWDLELQRGERGIRGLEVGEDGDDYAVRGRVRSADCGGAHVDGEVVEAIQWRGGSLERASKFLQWRGEEGE